MTTLNEQTIRRTAAPDPDHEDKPQKISKLDKGSFGYVFKRAINGFIKDGCTDLAASLTYFAVLSVFPGLLAIVSLLGVFGQGKKTTQAILDFLSSYAPSSMVSLLSDPINQLTSSSSAGFALVTGVIGALWSASGYVGGFGRALNRIYGVAEGRPFIKLKATMLAVTAAIVILAVVILLMILSSADMLNTISQLISVDISGFISIWIWLRWFVLLFAVIMMITLLYYGTPNIRQPKLRWLSPGAVLALFAMAVAGLGFSFYVSNFSKYNTTYGLIGGVIVLLLFIWIMNNVLLFGAQVDAELERVRELHGGIKAEKVIQLPPRDETQAIKALKAHNKLVAQGRKIRLQQGDSIDFQALAEEQDEK